MNIIFLDFDDIENPLLNAGQARATWEVATRLVKKGHRVQVITSRFPGYKDRNSENIIYTHIGLGSRHIKLNNIFYLLCLPFMVRKLRADIIIESFIPPFSVCFSPLFTSIPVVGLPSMFAAAEFAKKYNLPFHWVEKLGIKIYKYLLPYSDVDSGKAKKLNPTIDYHIVPEGVSKEYFQIKHQESKFILFLGRLDVAQKGIDLLLEAYATIKDKIGYPLVIAGHGSDEGKIRSLIDKLDLTDKVKLIGGVYGQKKFQVIANALFVAFPSRHEEMSLWSLEALAAGLPLVHFDIPEEKWISSEVSFKARPFDIQDYADKLLEATNSTVLLRKQAAARSFARQFSWDKVASEFEKYFEYVLHKEGTHIDKIKTGDNGLVGKNIVTVTIGIPAYNEEQNIEQLLREVSDQDVKGIRLDKIIVASDGSTDKTVNKVRSVRSPQIELLVSSRREGKVHVQNKILDKSKSDVLIFLDADVLIDGKTFLKDTVDVFKTNSKIALVSADTVSIKPASFIEKMVDNSHEMKKDSYIKIDSGNNVYMCHGRAIALARPFYQKLKLPGNYPADGFCYLSCLKQGFEFAFSPKTKIIFRSPTTLKDHLKQSTRFFLGRKKLENFFSPRFVQQQYFLPLSILLASTIKFLVKRPLLTTTYLLTYAYVRMLTIDDNRYRSKWKIAETSKKLI